MLYLYLKLLHIFFVISWLVGIFYLPRIFINLTYVKIKSNEYEILLKMGSKLFNFITPIALIACLLGFALALNLNLFNDKNSHWIHAKILLVFLLIIYHLWCYFILKKFENYSNKKNHIWYRLFNETPILLLLLILYLVIFKPF